MLVFVSDARTRLTIEISHHKGRGSEGERRRKGGCPQSKPSFLGGLFGSNARLRAPESVGARAAAVSPKSASQQISSPRNDHVTPFSDPTSLVLLDTRAATYTDSLGKRLREGERRFGQKINNDDDDKHY